MSVAGLIAVSLALKQSQSQLKIEKEWNCIMCNHFDQETTNDVTCCNCCENGEFFDKRKG